MTENKLPTTYSERLSGPRTDPDQDAGERQALTEYLDYYRRTFEMKCLGLTSAQLSERSAQPSTLSLHGLLRHLTGGERWWFQIQFMQQNDLPLLYYSDDEDPNEDFDRLDGDVDEAFALWHAECERSRQIVAAASSLDQTGLRFRDGTPFTLRWLMLRAIGEYARHCGHADLIREAIDGEVGE